jgi:hypothetical protein
LRFAALSATTGVTNGDFTISDPTSAQYGWTASGSASVLNGAGILSEDSQLASRLTQTFAIPDGAQRLQFTLTGGSMSSAIGIPPDAFEAALLDTASMTSLVDTTGLSGSDAFFNLQSSGAIYSSPLVTVTDLQGNVLSSIDFSQPVLVSIDLSGVTAGTESALYLDLLGFGALDSSLSIDDVRIITTGTPVNLTPTALADSASVAEDGSILIDVLANDSDPEKDFLAVTAIGSASHGTAAIENNQIRYTPLANYNGNDTFSYTVSDSAGNSTSSSVTVSVTPVNDAPILTAIPNYQVIEGVSLQVKAQGQDIDGDTLTYQLDQAPAGAAIDATTGLISWSAANLGTPADFTVSVSDGQARATQNFQVEVLPQGGINLAPTAADDQAGVVQNSSIRIDVLANDVDPEGAALMAVPCRKTAGSATPPRPGMSASTASPTPSATAPAAAQLPPSH